MSSRARPSLPWKLELWSRSAAALSMFVGLTVLIGGWALGVETIKGVYPGLATMKVNTALCFILSGAALWLLRDRAATRWARTAGGVAAGAVGFIAGLTLVEYLAGWDLGIDMLLFSPSDPGALSYPGRMSPVTALCFMFLAIGLVGLHRPALFHGAQWFGLASAFLAFLVMVSYLYSARSLRSVGPLTSYTDMALHTAVMMVLLAVGTTAARPGHGATAVLAKETAGGAVARWLLPVALLSPIVLGAIWLSGERRGYYALELGLAMMAVTQLALFSVVVWGTARRLHRADVQRLRAEAALHRLNANLEQQVRARTDSLAASEAQCRRLIEESGEGIVIHQAGVLRLVNPAAARMLGYADPAAAVGQPLRAHIAPEHRETALARIDARIQGTSVPMSNEMEVLRLDGGRLWIESTAVVMEWEGAPATRVTILDIGERRRRESAERQAESLRSVTMLANAAAHEINNPLTVVVGNLEILRRDLSDRPKAQTHVDRALSASQQIADMVSRMQRITRLEPLTGFGATGLTVLDLRRSSTQEPSGSSGT